jgi:hypothetical protein
MGGPGERKRRTPASVAKETTAIFVAIPEWKKKRRRSSSPSRNGKRNDGDFRRHPGMEKETAAIFIAAVRCVSDPELLSAMRQALPPVPRSGNCSLCELMF